jgi:hypothetical protein
MDYARFNYVAQPEDRIGEKGLFPRINDYDRWAIKWGYQWRPEFKDEFEEKEKLMKETSDVLRQNPRLWFGGEGTNEDPRAQTEDLSDNSVKASEYGLKNLKRVMENLPKWTKQDNDQYEDLQEMYTQVLSQFSRYQNHVLKCIAGRYLNNMPGLEPIANQPKVRQKDAVKYIGKNIFDAPEWLFPSQIINKVGVNPNTQQISRQDNVLGRMLDGYILNKLNNQAYAEGEAYPVEEYLDDVFVEVWKPLTDANEWKNKMRRSLQRSYVGLLDRLVNTPEKTASTARTDGSDVQLYLLLHLNKLEQYLKSQAGGASINALHYADLQDRVQLIRERHKSPYATK